VTGTFRNTNEVREVGEELISASPNKPSPRTSLSSLTSLLVGTLCFLTDGVLGHDGTHTPATG
jgi:hypothetical protein